MTLPVYAPMLAVAWDAPFDDDDWIFEPKYDGIRSVATITDSGWSLRSRNGNDLTSDFPDLATLSELPIGLILDGEIVATDEDGRPSFELLQARRQTATSAPAAISYMAFDVLAVAGTPVIDRTIEERTAMIAGLDLPPCVQESLRVEGRGTALYAATGENGLEGIVAKRRGSLYRPGERSPSWRKIAHVQRMRAMVAGFTQSTGAGAFGALLLGLWDGHLLRYVGSVGTGFDHRSATAIREALDQMVIDETPFHVDDAIPEATFVHPNLVAEVEFKHWTRAGRLRAPSFKGFSDRSIDEATWESEGPTV